MGRLSGILHGLKAGGAPFLERLSRLPSSCAPKGYAAGERVMAGTLIRWCRCMSLRGEGKG
jgi:hypothetical protein